jgi:hypothetical protein
MKSLIIFLLAFSVSLQAACKEELFKSEVMGQYLISTDVPSHLKGATITVTKADGTSSNVPAEQFKVVPRKQQFITKHTQSGKIVSCEGLSAKNRVRLMGGVGPNGLKESRSGTTVTIKSRQSEVFGAGYDRLLTDKFSLGLQGFSNGQGTIGLGIDF